MILRSGVSNRNRTDRGRTENRTEYRPTPVCDHGFPMELDIRVTRSYRDGDRTGYYRTDGIARVKCSH